MFPEIYTVSEKRGFDLKSNFHLIFKAYRDKMAIKQQQLAKQPTNYLNQSHEKFEFEQKPIKNFDEFSDTEENDLKEKAQLQNKKRKKTVKIRR